jgi:two-component system chemotaxis response regulator CheB
MPPARGAIRVLFIDDTSATRQLCGDRLSREHDLHILEIVSDPVVGLRRIKTESPDVVVIDIEMPRTNGIALIKQIMSEKPTPIVVFSPMTGKNAALAVEALGAGALFSVKKPQTSLLSSLQDAGLKLSSAIREASRARFRITRSAAPTTLGLDSRSLQTTRPTTATRVTDAYAAQSAPQSSPPVVRGNVPLPIEGIRVKNSADAMLSAKPGVHAQPGGEKIIAIGSSTGGTQALEVVLTKLPARCPGIVIVQHMPEKFTAMFAARLDSMCQMTVREACNGDRVQVGQVLIAPGGKHLMIKRSGNSYTIEIADGPLVNRHKPSVDLMFRSVAMAAGRSAMGFLLTGMGDDGARGMKELHDTGAKTVAQDEFSCVVFGMPKVAIALGGVDKILPLDKIAQEIIGYAA